MTPAIECSVIIPCLNEEKTVALCVRKARRFLEERGIAGEVLVIDNGSTDRSAETAREAGARVVVHDVKGYGSALKRGIAESRGQYVIMGDADDTYDFSRLDEFIVRLRRGDDLVMGSRLKGEIQPHAMPWLHRYVGTPVLTWLINRFYRAGISDTNCGLRGFRREAVQQLGLSCNGMEFASEMVIKAARKRLKISETPVPYHANGGDGARHLRSFRDGWRHLRLILMLCPQYLLLAPGLIMFLVGLVFSCLMLVRPVVIGGIPMGLSAGMFAGAIMLVGVQVALLGILGMLCYGAAGLMAEDRVCRFFRLRFTLERGILTGCVLVLIGLVIGAVAIGMLVHIATTIPYVDISITRLAMISIFVTLLGIQVVFGSFYVGLLDLNKTLE